MAAAYRGRYHVNSVTVAVRGQSHHVDRYSLVSLGLWISAWKTYMDVFRPVIYIIKTNRAKCYANCWTNIHFQVVSPRRSFIHSLNLLTDHNIIIGVTSLFKFNKSREIVAAYTKHLSLCRVKAVTLIAESAESTESAESAPIQHTNYWIGRVRPSRSTA